MSTTREFPSLKTIVEYGLYSIYKLEQFSKGELKKRRDIIPLRECTHCDFVYAGYHCDNCVGVITRPSADSKSL
jgi:hypothetical protein